MSSLLQFSTRSFEERSQLFVLGCGVPDCRWAGLGRMVSLGLATLLLRHKCTNLAHSVGAHMYIIYIYTYIHIHIDIYVCARAYSIFMRYSLYTHVC